MPKHKPATSLKRSQTRKTLKPKHAILKAHEILDSHPPAPKAEPRYDTIDWGSRFALMNEPKSQILLRLNNSKWAAAKRALVADNRFPFLEPFGDDLSVDQIVYDETSALIATPPAYDWYQLEGLVSSVSALLDRCLSNRREMYDIEEQAIRRALEYKLFFDQYQPQLAIEMAASIEAQRGAERDGQKNAIQKFEGATDKLTIGSQAIAKGALTSAEIAISGEQDRKREVQQKWDALRQYQQALQDRHITPGCSLNFAERYGRLEQLLRQDIRIAFQKLRSIQGGLKQVFGLDIPLTPPQTNGYLDAMVMFLRDVIEQTELFTQSETEFVHVVSLNQSVVTKPDGTAPNQLFTPAQWAAAVGPQGNGVLEFSLKNEFPTPVKSLRVRGIGLSVLFQRPIDDVMVFGTGSTNLPVTTAQHPRMIAAIIFPPRPANIFSPIPSSAYRPPVIIGNATWLDPLNPRLVTSAAAGNLDPRNGKWSVQVSPNIINAKDLSGGGRAAGIADVKLHLKLAAIFDDTIDPPWTFYG